MNEESREHAMELLATMMVADRVEKEKQRGDMARIP